MTPLPLTHPGYMARNFIQHLSTLYLITAMDAFSSGYVGNPWHDPSGYPAYPTPADTQFGFDTLDLTSTFAGDPNNIIQPDSWFFEGWLDVSGVVQTEQSASQESTAAACPEYDSLGQPHPAQEDHSRAVPKGQENAELRPSKTVTELGWGVSGG
ncbi:hypothetical protein ACKLNR_013997 [Fusarium oxysporum f. sp. zingiberi]